jgi:hypothetical protein
MRKAPARRRRRATVTVELLLVLPVLLILLFGTIEFGMLLTARCELLAASREGARTASHGGGNRKALNEEVRAAVREALGEGRLADADVDIFWSSEGRRKRRPERERVEVVVHVPARHVVPDLLGWAGVSIEKERLEAATVMLVEK